MVRIQEWEARRNQVLRELAAIRSLRKGSLNEQWFPIVRDGKRTKEFRGPYFVWTCKAGKKTVSERLNDAQAIARARQDAANYRRFRELCVELERLTAHLGQAERKPDTASSEAVKRELTNPCIK